MTTMTATQPTLTLDEEGALARRIEAGLMARYVLDGGTTRVRATDEELAHVARDGARAYEELFLANRGLVMAVVRRDAPRDVFRDELVQDGYVGLAEAIRSFDWTRGTKFSTWAYPIIRSHVAEARRLHRSGVRIPVRHMRRAARAGEKALEVTTLPPGDGNRALAVEMEDTAPPDVIWALVRHALAGLDREQQDVLACRFGLHGARPQSQNATARELRITVSRVRTVEAAALRRLRSHRALLDVHG